MYSKISGLITLLTLASTIALTNSSPSSSSQTSLTTTNKWVVLVAGSNEYYNYRHQADIYHAYQIFHDNGYPDSQIIVMQYDDIAYNPSNPFQGIVLNDVGGRNMYVNIPKDYTGEHVTPKNFLSVLLGESTNSTKKVITPSPMNDIFIYFADHGAPGLIGFPNGDVLYAHELNETFTSMYSTKSYNSIVFYMEACESGSMFNRILSPHINVYAVTASTPQQSSWACCQDDTVNAYLGDTFSVNWLENVDSFERVMNQSLLDMFKVVQNETDTSHVCEYGDLSMASLNVSKYLVYTVEGFERKEKTIQMKEKVNVKRTGRNSREASLEGMLNLCAQSSGEALYSDWDESEYMTDLNGGNECYPKEVLDTRCLKRKIEEFELNKGSKLSEFEFKLVRHIGWECFKCVVE